MRYEIAGGLVADKVGDELVLTLPSGDIAVLNGGAAVVFGAIKSCSDKIEQVDVAADALQDAYGIDLKLAQRDARKALSQLRTSAKELVLQGGYSDVYENFYSKI